MNKELLLQMIKAKEEAIAALSVSNKASWAKAQELTREYKYSWHLLKVEEQALSGLRELLKNDDKGE